MKKKLSLKTILIGFFLVQFVIALFMSWSIHIGRNPETGQFIWFSKSDMTMIDNIQYSINTEMFPDVYVREQGFTDAEKYQYTYGSKRLYDFFYKMFHENSPIKFFGDDTAILNFRLWRMLFFMAIFIIVGAILIRRSMNFIPSKTQIVCEIFYDFFDSLAVESLREKAPKFLPYFLTLFLFIWLSNMTGLLPIPGLAEPTRNLNFPLGLGIVAMSVVQLNALKKKGFANYIKGFCEPFTVLLPLNIVGELSKVVSISFRLFGNIFGGAIILLVVSNLSMNIMIPVGLNMFFTMFSGTIQAYVFTMLSLTFLSLEITDID
jgi:F-type H+-transporting ATPase subunit a